MIGLQSSLYKEVTECSLLSQLLPGRLVGPPRLLKPLATSTWFAWQLNCPEAGSCGKYVCPTGWAVCEREAATTGYVLRPLEEKHFQHASETADSVNETFLIASSK